MNFISIEIKESRIFGNELLCVEGKIKESGHNVAIYENKIQSCSAFLGKVSDAKEFFKMCLQAIAEYEKASSVSHD